MVYEPSERSLHIDCVRVCAPQYNTFSSFTAYLPATGQLVPLACEKFIHLLNCRDLPVLAQEVVLLVDQGLGRLICLVQFFGNICATKLVNKYRW